MTTPETRLKAKYKLDLKKQGRDLITLSDRYATGYPDFIECYDGRMICHELKAHKGVVSAKQVAFARRITRAGGTYFIVRASKDKATEYTVTVWSEPK